MTPIAEMTEDQLREEIRIARRLAKVSSIHREYLEELEEEASLRKIKI